MSETKRVNKKKIIQGVITSDKMQKTRVVQVKWAQKHDRYQKFVRRTAKYKAHDEQNASKAGDTVKIMETRPLSKDKRWVITEIVKKA